MPRRTSFTPSSSTLIRRREVATTVLGRSTTTRAGWSSWLNLGCTVPCAVISTPTPSSIRTTFTFCRAACPAASVAVLWVWAAVAMSTTITSIGSKTVRNCFLISLSPTGLALGSPRIFLTRFASAGFPANLQRRLDGRRRNLLGHFPGERLAHPALNPFLKDDRVAGDLHHIAVEHRIVLPQEISFIQTVHHDSDHA